MIRPSSGRGQRATSLTLGLAIFLVCGTAAAAPWGQAGSEEPVDPRLQQAIELYTGVGGTVDDARAHDLLVEAVADEDPISYMWLARCYSRGRMEFGRDDERARAIAGPLVDTIRAMAEADVAEAAFLMGTAYDEGLGVEADPAQAAAWYHRAADQDHVLAQHNLGNAYRSGRAVPQSDSFAAYWWRQAAVQGDAIPQFQLGRLYENGEGVGKDLDQARHWYREAADRGNRSAQEALERLGDS